MNSITSLSLAAVLGLLAVTTSGCASDASAQEPLQTTESAVSEDALRSEARIVADFKRAVVGLESNGGEGDPDPFKVILVQPQQGDTMSFPSLAKRIGPAIPELPNDYCEDEAPVPCVPNYGFQSGTTMSQYWAEKTAAPNPADYVGDAAGLRAERAKVQKYLKLKTLVAQNLRTPINLTIGVQAYGSIENGAVAQVLVGKLPSGKLLVIYGIDIWT